MLEAPFLSLDGTSVEMASLLFLFLAVLVIVGVKRRRQLARRIVQALSVGVFFWVVYSCLGVFGMIRNGLFGLTLLGSVYTESFFWMALPVVVISATLVTGPVFCGWICPTGTLQDLASYFHKRLALRRAKATRRQLAVLGAALAVFLCLLIWLSVKKQMFIEDSSLHWAAALLLVCYLVLAGVVDDRPTRALRVVSVLAIVVTAVFHLSVSSPVHFAFSSRDDPASALATLVIVIASLSVLRAFCRYLCPWGYVMGLLHRFSRLRIAKVPSLCTDCKSCERACAVAAVDARGVRADACQFCLACVDACPPGSLQVVDAWQEKERALRVPAGAPTCARR
ncbi:MAG: 4Fe-4S binding protein [Myxococcaceae bacterium]